MTTDARQGLAAVAVATRDAEASRTGVEGLIVDSELRDCLPRLSPNALGILESQIVEGKLEPVVTVWNDRYILDGHCIKEICDRHGIPYRIASFDAPSKEAAIIHRIKRHLGRRNMSAPQILEAVCRLEKTLLAEARKNQRLGPGKKALGQVVKTFEKKHTNERIAEWTDLSPTTVKRFRKVRNFGNPDIFADMMTGKATINKAYDKVCDIETDRYRKSILGRETSFANPPAGNWNNVIINEDNMTVLKRMAEEIPHTVDLFVFDPPWNAGKDYGQGADPDRLPYAQYIEDLVKRFALFAPCLKTGGKVACILRQARVHQHKQLEGEDALHPIDADLILGVRRLDCGLRLWDRIPYVKPAGREVLGRTVGPSQFCPLLRPHWGLILVWAYQTFSPPQLEDVEPDYTNEEFDEWSMTPWTIAQDPQKTHLHPGATPSALVERIIKLFAPPGSLVVDPYNGTGTTTKLCKVLGRRYVGIDQTAAFCSMAAKATKAAGAA